jgi:hypothetical protein
VALVPEPGPAPPPGSAAPPPAHRTQECRATSPTSAPRQHRLPLSASA